MPVPQLWDDRDPKWQLLCAYWQMERSETVVNLLRQIGNGVISDYCQQLLLDFCIHNPISASHPPDHAYVTRVLKSVIAASESDGVELIDDLYSSLGYFMSESPLDSSSFSTGLVHGGPGWCWKTFVYSVPNSSPTFNNHEREERNLAMLSNQEPSMIKPHASGSNPPFSEEPPRPSSTDISQLSFTSGSRNTDPTRYFQNRQIVSLKVSSNLLQGGTGCCIWPAAFVLSEFLLWKPETVVGKRILELGAGSGLVGICVARLPIVEAILTDGDWETLLNMQTNLSANGILISNDIDCDKGDHKESKDVGVSSPFASKVKCHSLLWENALESTLQDYGADVILGADIIYDPNTNHHLTRVLSILLRPKLPSASSDAAQTEQPNRFEMGPKPVAYIAAAIRNESTMNQFIQLIKDLDLNISNEQVPKACFEHLSDLNRESIRIFRITF